MIVLKANPSQMNSSHSHNSHSLQQQKMPSDLSMPIPRSKWIWFCLLSFSSSWFLPLLLIANPNWSPPILCNAELREESGGFFANNLNQHQLLASGIYGDEQRITLLRKVLRQSGFDTDEEIDEAIIALGPPPKKRLRKLASDELLDEKQENFDEDQQKGGGGGGGIHRRLKRDNAAEENEREEEEESHEEEEEKLAQKGGADDAENNGRNTNAADENQSQIPAPETSSLAFEKEEDADANNGNVANGQGTLEQRNAEENNEKKEESEWKRVNFTLPNGPNDGQEKEKEDNGIFGGIIGKFIRIFRRND